ncbi:MAG: WG repeat-containing protein [Cytophagaceae bacterium]
MKRLVLSALLLISIIVKAQEPVLYFENSNLIAPAQQNGKWGYVNTKGEWVIPPTYVYAKPFNNGLAEVKMYAEGKARIGLINKENKLVTELKGYNISKYSEGLLVFKEGELYGYMDTTGNKVIPAQFNYCAPFREGKAAVTFKDGKIGYIDKSKKLFISPRFYSASEYSEGIAVVSTGIEAHKRKYSCIDDKGNQIIAPEYNWITSFSEGYAFANIGGYLENNVVLEGKWYIIDAKGNKVPASADSTLGVEIQSYPYILKFVNGVAWFPANVNGKQKFGLIDVKGKWVLEPKYEYVGKFSEGRASVFDNNRYGFIDAKGNIVIQNFFESVGDFHHGLAWFKVDEKYGVIDKNGKIVIDAKFQEIGDFAEVK